MNNEIWKLVKGYDHQYEVSNFGNVRNHKFDRILTLITHHTGYIKVNLYKNNKSKQFSVNVLVAKAFIPNPENKPQTNHIDGDKANNKVTNLEWCTASENALHACRTGLWEPPRCQGEQQGNSILTDNKVLQIRSIHSQGWASNREIADAYGVAPNTISQIVNRKRWLHI